MRKFNLKSKGSPHYSKLIFPKIVDRFQIEHVYGINILCDIPDYVSPQSRSILYIPMIKYLLLEGLSKDLVE
jgi:hypothetical protein